MFEEMKHFDDRTKMFRIVPFLSMLVSFLILQIFG